MSRFDTNFFRLGFLGLLSAWLLYSNEEEVNTFLNGDNVASSFAMVILEDGISSFTAIVERWWRQMTLPEAGYNFKT